MARVTQDNVTMSPGLLERNPHFAEILSGADPEAICPASGASAAAPEAAEPQGALYASEKDYQDACEHWLRQRGYWPRTPGHILHFCGEEPERVLSPGKFRGWYLHMHKARQNPIILDFLILGRDGRYLEVELKAVNGQATPEQAALIRHGGRLCRDCLVPFSAVVLAWEADGSNEGRGA